MSIPKSFSVFPLFVIGGIVIIVGLVVVAGFSSCIGNVSGMNQTTAEQEARDYAGKMGLQVQGVDCARNDSDGDGYVSCSLSIKQPDGSLKLQPIECAVKISTNSGCRIPKMTTPNAR